MRIYVAAALLLVAGLANGQSVSFGSRLIVVGDGVGKVFEIAGRPDRTVQLVNKYGAGVGERFEYYRGGKTITITVSGGQVTDVAEFGA